MYAKLKHLDIQFIRLLGHLRVNPNTQDLAILSASLDKLFGHMQNWNSKPISLLDSDIQGWQRNMIVVVMQVESPYFVKLCLTNVFKFLYNLMVKWLDETVLLHFLTTDQLENFPRLVSPSVVCFYRLFVRNF